MKKLLCCIGITLFFLFPSVVSAKKLDLDYVKSFGGTKEDLYNKVISTSDGGYLVIGNTLSSVTGKYTNYGNADGLIAKYSSDGEQLWVHNLGGTAEDYFTGVCETTDGNYVVVGYSRSSKILNASNHGYIDSIYAKYDKNGNLLYNGLFGFNVYEFFNDVIATDDGGFLAVGQIGAKNIDDGLAVKFSKEGAQEWYNFYGDGTGTYSDCLDTIIKVDDGYVAAGYSASKITGVLNNNGEEDGFIIKFNTTGHSLWYKNVGGAGPDFINSLSQTSDGGFIIGGYGYIDTSKYTKVQNPGSKSLIKSVVRTSDLRDTIDVTSLYVDDDYEPNPKYFNLADSYPSSLSNGLLAGSDDNSVSDLINDGGNSIDIFNVKFDEDFNPEWSNVYGGSSYDVNSGFIETKDGSYLQASHSSGVIDNDIQSNGYNDCYLFLFDKSGKVYYKTSFGDENNDLFYNLIEDSNNPGTYIAVGQTTVDPSEVGKSSPNYDAIIVKFDTHYDIKASVIDGNGSISSSVRYIMNGRKFMLSFMPMFGFEVSEVVINNKVYSLSEMVDNKLLIDNTGEDMDIKVSYKKIPEPVVDNPITSDNIITFVIIFIISIACLTGILVYLKKHKKN